MSLSSAAQRVVYLSLFVAHGWIVELMNCFSEQDNPDLISKCLKRLEDLINLEEMLCLITAEFANWRSVLFDSYSFTEVNEHEGTTEESPTKAKTSTSTSDACADWKIYARQLEPQAIGLLRITAPKSQESKKSKVVGKKKGQNVHAQGPTVEPPSLLYLLEHLMRILSQNVQHDLVKLSLKGNFLSAAVLQTSKSAAKKNSSRIIDIASTKSPLELFGDLRTALNSLAPQLSCSLHACGLTGNGVPSSNPEQIEIFKSCAILCLKCLAGFLTMSSIKDASMRELVFGVLASVHFDTSPLLLPSVPIAQEDVHAAAKHAFGQLRNKLVEVSGISDDDIHDSNPGSEGKMISLGIEGYVVFLAALEALYGQCSPPGRAAIGGRLSDSAGRFLEKDWGNCFTTKRTRKFLPGMVRIYIQCADDPFELVDELRERLTTFSTGPANDSHELSNVKADPDDTSNSKTHGWGSLTPDTYHTYASCVFEQYLILFMSLKPGKHENTEEAFAEVQKYLEALMPLFELSRNNELVLGAAMRAGRMIIDVFIKTWIPWLKEKFSHYKKLVMKTLKMKQKSTRLLQTFCNHSKGLQDSHLTCLVPPLKKSMEVLLFCVKGLMLSQNHAKAYTIGNLKHRNLSGDVISSQEQYKSESEGSSESEYESDDEAPIERQAASRSLKRVKQESSPAGKRKLDSLVRKRPKSKTEMSRKRTNPTENDSKTNGSHRVTTQSDGDNEEQEEEDGDQDMEEDVPLIHSLAPHNPELYKKEKAKRKRRKTIKSRFIEYEAEEAGDSDGEDNDADANGNLSGFVVNDSSGDEQ